MELQSLSIRGRGGRSALRNRVCEMSVGPQLLQVALNRLQYWRIELERARIARDAQRIEQCFGLIEEYTRLVADMVAILRADDLPKA